jgi:hypothetical protein
MSETISPQGRYLKLAFNFYLLWGVLCFVVGTKVLLLRGATGADFAKLGIFALGMLAVAYLGAWAVWAFSGKKQRIGEIAFVVILVAIFLIPTVGLYIEGFAARD